MLVTSLQVHMAMCTQIKKKILTLWIFMNV